MLPGDPNNPAITRLVGAMLLEQNDEWCLQRRYIQLEAFEAVSDNPQAKQSAVINLTVSSVASAMMRYTTSWDTINQNSTQGGRVSGLPEWGFAGFGKLAKDGSGILTAFA